MNEKKNPQFVYSGDSQEPTAVILDIADYREMLERLEDAADLRALDEMRRTEMNFRSLDEFFGERAGV